MATITKFVDGLSTPELLANEVVKKENVIDLSIVDSASGDTVQCLKVPAGAFVSRVGVLVITVEDSTLTGTVGDEADPNGWDASVNFENLGMNVSDLDESTDAYGEGKYYPAEDTIDVVMSANAGDTAKFMVWAEMRIIENRA